MSAGAAPRETEAVLWVCAAQPESFVAQLAALRNLGGYRLIPMADERIRDVFFDTPDLALRARRVALRVREKNGRFLLTVKGEAQRGDWGVRRLEREVP